MTRRCCFAAQHWMYRPVELQDGEAVPLGDGSWTVEEPGWHLLWFAIIKEPTIADTIDTNGPVLFEFKIAVTDCTGQTMDTEEFYGKRYYFLIEP